MQFTSILAMPFVIMTLLPQAVQAETTAYPIADLSLRAGPSVRFPAVAIMRRGSYVYLHGCIRNYTWCDISAGPYRGWASASYLDIDYSSRRYRAPVYAERIGVPIITFEVDTYWDDFYDEGYEFYDTRTRWNDYIWEDDGVPPGWGDWNDDDTTVTIEEYYDGTTSLVIEEPADECTYGTEDGLSIPIEGCTVDSSIPLD
jgi:uncharacterized protein YraI